MPPQATLVENTNNQSILRQWKPSFLLPVCRPPAYCFSAIGKNLSSHFSGSRLRPIRSKQVCFAEIIPGSYVHIFLRRERNRHACIIPYCLPYHEPCAHYGVEWGGQACPEHSRRIAHRFSVRVGTQCPPLAISPTPNSSGSLPLWLWVSICREIMPHGVKIALQNFQKSIFTCFPPPISPCSSGRNPCLKTSP